MGNDLEHFWIIINFNFIFNFHPQLETFVDQHTHYKCTGFTTGKFHIKIKMETISIINKCLCRHRRKTPAQLFENF